MKYIVVVTTLIIFFFGQACNLERDIKVDLPEYNRQLVVECYLEHGQPYRLLLTESLKFTDAPEIPDVPNAKVLIFHNGQTIQLSYTPTLDSTYGKFYNYVSPQVVDSTSQGEYFLEIEDTQGRKLTGKCSFLPKVPIIELSYEFEDDKLEMKNDSAEASLTVRHFEDQSTLNYYRLLVNEIEKDSNGTIFFNTREIDFTYQGIFATNNEVTIASLFRFNDNELLQVRLFHLEKQYYDYLESIEATQNASGNPFGQPAPILSGVKGGLGIFTTLSYDTKSILITKQR